MDDLGKTPKPTRLLIHPDLADWTTLQSLVSQGHTVTVGRELFEYDVVLGPNCWMMDKDLEPYLLTHTMPEARKRAEERKKRAV